MIVYELYKNGVLYDVESAKCDYEALKKVASNQNFETKLLYDYEANKKDEE